MVPRLIAFLGQRRGDLDGLGLLEVQGHPALVPVEVEEDRAHAAE